MFQCQLSYFPRMVNLYNVLFQTHAEGISVKKIKFHGEVKFVPMDHCIATTNTTDMPSQTEVKLKLTDI